MFEFLTGHSDQDAIVILKHDHDKVKDLFEQFEKAETLAQKRKIAAETVTELKIHAAIEEEMFYPTVRKSIGKDIMNEADEEHHVAKVLIAELEMMNGTEDHFDAKYKVLAENIRHHIKEEEGDMFPKARGLDVDMEALGSKMLAYKQQLMKTGVAIFAEEKMVKASKGKSDSPAEAAKLTKAIDLPKVMPKAAAGKVVSKKVAAKA